MPPMPKIEHTRIANILSEDELELRKSISNTNNYLDRVPRGVFSQSDVTGIVLMQRFSGNL